MRGKLTKRAVDALKPIGDKERVLWDAGVKGFGLRARPGGSKVYILRYRPGAGGRHAPLRTFTIGSHGSPWTADTARAEAKRLLGLVEDGADPAADRMAGRTAPTVKELCARFMAEHVDAKRKGRTIAEYRRLVDKIILPALGGRRVADVTQHDVGKLHHAHRTTPYQANRLLAVISKMMNLAEAWRMRGAGSNPCRHLERYGEAARRRMLSADELGALGEALSAYETTGGNAYVVGAIKLLVFTGARLSEVLGLKWEWVDFERAEARLPDSKTGAKTLHLPPPALAVLADLPRIEGNPHVIVGAVEGASLVGLGKPWRDIRGRASVLIWANHRERSISTLVADLKGKLERDPRHGECLGAATASGIALPGALLDVRLHDLRHAFASVAAASGLGLPIIGALLGHTQPATTARYAHLGADPLKQAAAAVAGKIAGAMEGGVADVLNLRK